MIGPQNRKDEIAAKFYLAQNKLKKKNKKKNVMYAFLFVGYIFNGKSY